MRTASRPATKTILTLLVVGLLCGSGWTLWVLAEQDSRLPKLALTLPQERERAKAAGLPCTFAELPKHPPVAPKDNAAPFYRKAVALPPEIDRDLIGRWLGDTKKQKPQDAEAIQQLLSRCQPALAWAERGLQRPHCDFGWQAKRDLSEQEWVERSVLLRELTKIAWLFLCQARAHERHNIPAALNAIRWAEQITAHMTEEGGVYVVSVRFQALMNCWDILWRIAVKTPESLEAVQAVGSRLKLSPRVLQTAWHTTFIQALLVCKQLRARSYKPQQQPFLDYNPLWRELDRLDFVLDKQQWADASEVVNLRYWRQVREELAKVPDDDTLAPFKTMVNLDRIEEERAKNIPGYPQCYRYSNTALIILGAEYLGRLHQTGLACLRFRRIRGHWPKTLDELPRGTPILNIDTGKPFLYKPPFLGGIQEQSKPKKFYLRLDGLEE